jgi:hypothetical protein
MRHHLAQLTEALARTAAALARETGAEEPAPAEPVAAEPEPPVRPVEHVAEPAPAAVDAEAVEDSEAVEDVEVVDAEEAPAAVEPDLDVMAERRRRREDEEPAPAAAGDDESDQHLAARLVALQMAVAGGNRSEVEGHLRRAFELDSPASILDDIFGEGTGPDSRVAWPETATRGSRG